MRWSYDANFKLMVIKHAEETRGVNKGRNKIIKCKELKS
jgi:hypothetical protein